MLKQTIISQIQVVYTSTFLFTTSLLVLNTIYNWLLKISICSVIVIIIDLVYNLFVILICSALLY